MRKFIPLLIALPILAACTVKSDDKDKSEVTIDKTVTVKTDGDTSTVSIGGDHGFKLDTDKFKAAIDIPGMSIGGKDMDIDGMKLFPGSTVGGMKVVASEKDGRKDGNVVITFASPATPAAVLDHAASEAKREGWTISRTATGLGGTKGDKTLAYAVAASGTTTKGTVTLTGDD